MTQCVNMAIVILALAIPILMIVIANEIMSVHSELKTLTNVVSLLTYRFNAYNNLLQELQKKIP